MIRAANWMLAAQGLLRRSNIFKVVFILIIGLLEMAVYNIY